MSGELTDDDIKEMRRTTLATSHKEEEEIEKDYEVKNPTLKLKKPKSKPKEEPQIVSTRESMKQLEETKQEQKTEVEMVTITKGEYERLKVDLDLAKANIKIMADAMIYSDCISMQRTGAEINRSLVLTTRQVVIYNEIKNKGIQQQNQGQNQ